MLHRTLQRRVVVQGLRTLAALAPNAQVWLVLGRIRHRYARHGRYRSLAATSTRRTIRIAGADSRKGGGCTVAATAAATFRTLHHAAPATATIARLAINLSAGTLGRLSCRQRLQR